MATSTNRRGREPPRVEGALVIEVLMTLWSRFWLAIADRDPLTRDKRRAENSADFPTPKVNN